VFYKSLVGKSGVEWSLHKFEEFRRAVLGILLSLPRSTENLNVFKHWLFTCSTAYPVSSSRRED
jgi:hypothetical protein